MFVGNDHLLVKIEASNFEKNIILKGEILEGDINKNY